ncbi:MAG TPA: prepilin-type N-terminal cleavage/methylation domain-containing protein [Terriglobales bacterium]|nr:prepilin-type N-terminal cleavage/methylation domain-containing protein [Terriglobales bacterium]
MDFRHAHGFSVVEILAAIALMAIMAAMALPAWNKLLPAHYLNSSVRQIQSELQNLKIRAAAENLGFQIEYLTDASDYTVLRDGKPMTRRFLPEGITIVRAGTIFFSPRGTAGANRIRLHSSDGRCRHVVVSATGRIRNCRPDNCAEDC